MYPFDIEIIYGIFNAISDTIIRKQEVSFTSCFLYTLKQSAIFDFAEKGLKAGVQTKRLSYSSPADSRYACITDSLGYIINHAFSLLCASVKKSRKKNSLLTINLNVTWRIAFIKKKIRKTRFWSIVWYRFFLFLFYAESISPAFF